MVKGRKKAARILLSSVAVLFLGISLVLVAGAMWIKANFQTTLPNDFFSMTVIGQAPHFFVYTFEDRENRIGTRSELEVDGFSHQNTDYVSYTDLPQHLIDAFVSIEDKHFFDHKGVDWYRTAAACVTYLFQGSKSFGASGITQQLIKNMTGNDEPTPSRKIQEMLYAIDLERRLDKTEILELYVNIIHFSDRCDGVAEAAQHYFGKQVGDLTPAESACIAAITNNPSYYNPIRNPQNNQKRRNLILLQMQKQGYLSQKEYESALGEELLLRESDTQNGEAIHSWYIDMVIEDVINDLVRQHGISRNAASSLVYRGGLQIDLAMDSRVQATVEEYYRNAVQTPMDQNGMRAQSALIVLDSHTGDILGVAGGIGEKRANRIQNFATQTKRPPGSVIKPLSVYAPALEEGLINWASVYDDVPVNFGKDNKSPWPKNATGVYRGLTNVSYAVAHSTNTVAVRVLKELGLERSYWYAKSRFGLKSMVENDCDVAALALGQLNYGVTLRELTGAYTVFADAGIYHEGRSYYRVLSADGRLLLDSNSGGVAVLSEGNAAIMTKLLQGVVERGTSSSITLNQIVECAGKTGTTNADGDRWFVGYTPDMICGVWCGYEYPQPIKGRNVCTDIWNRVMTSLYEELGGQTRFSVPNSLIRASYCADSGKLLTQACEHDPRGNREEVGWFLEDQLPHTHCERHVLCKKDPESGEDLDGCSPANELVGLLRIDRDFPVPITVSDAKYAVTEQCSEENVCHIPDKKERRNPILNRTGFLHE